MYSYQNGMIFYQFDMIKIKLIKKATQGQLYFPCRDEKIRNPTSSTPCWHDTGLRYSQRVRNIQASSKKLWTA